MEEEIPERKSPSPTKSVEEEVQVPITALVSEPILVEASPEPIQEPEPKVVPEPEPQPEVTPEPQVEIVLEPQVDIVLEPQVEIVLEPQVDIVLQPQVEIVLEPQVDAVLEPQVDAVLEPPIDIVLEPRVDTVLEPRVEKWFEPQVEKVVQPQVLKLLEPQVELDSELETEIAAHSANIDLLINDDGLDDLDDLDQEEGNVAQEEEEPSASLLNDEHVCSFCEEKFKVPRVLSCLHVFCTECLEKKLKKDDESRDENQNESECLVDTGSITCSICKQRTLLSATGVTGLPQDYVLANMMDISAIEDMQIICTSCKAKEKAVARCSDCANFLCANCVTAHQYMRCFENHKVVSFDELQSGDGIAIHKPLFCTSHMTESMKYFCHTCQIPVCSECIVNEHKQPGHNSERISALEEKPKGEIQNLISEAKSKVDYCNEASSILENSLSELQMQRDDARGLIQETFQTYKATLEKRQETLLKELEEIHTNQELSIMEMFHNVEKTIEKIEDSSAFTERVLKNGNIEEILSLKKLMSTQLLHLINNTPKPDINFKIEFESDPSIFGSAIEDTFGSFRKQLAQPKIPDAQPASLHSSFENENLSLPGMRSVLGPDRGVIPGVTDTDLLSGLPPLSLPNVDLGPLASNIAGISVQTMNSIASSIQSLQSGGAPVVSAPPPVPPERSSSRNSYSPAQSDSGISVDNASTGSGSRDQAMALAGLANKLGPAVSVNGQGQITLNGQAVPGLNMNNMMGLPQPMSTRVQTPTTPTPDASSLASLLSAVNMTNTSSSRSQTPQLNDLSGLLGSQSPNINGLGAIGGPPSPADLLSQPNRDSSMLSGLQVSTSFTGMNIPPPTTPTGSSPFPSPLAAGAPPLPIRNTTKMGAMQIRCKFGQLGPGKGQFNSPHGFCLGLEEDIIVADTNNHRIQVFEKTGEFKYQFGIPGREEGQLWYPRKVAVIRHSGKYVVCDRGNERSRMQIFAKNGHFIKKIAIRYIDIVAGLAITNQGHIVAVDSVSPTVFCIAENGELIKWFDCSDYMREPSDIAINGKEYFVCDFKGHCVVVFNEDGQFMRRIGCENITNFPNGIDISDAGDVLVGDSHGNRFHVAVFQKEGSLVGEFECPYVKVSRCCGLKITSEGYVVTLAKNNHHVLVLNTLYIA